ARCRSMALAAILCARARILNSLSPKRWASSVVMRLAASSSISAATASWISRASRSTSACFSGGTGVEGMMDSSSGLGILLARHASLLVYKNSTNFQDAHRAGAAGPERPGFPDRVLPAQPSGQRIPSLLLRPDLLIDAA